MALHTFERYYKKYGKATQAIMEIKKTRNVLPWSLAYRSIRARCVYGAHGSKYYEGAGIKCKIRPIELKELYFRDKAWTLTKPSIDRINPDGHYEVKNLQWIEEADNRIQRVLNNPYRYKIFKNIQSALTREFDKACWPIYVRKAFLKKCWKEIK